jgi:exodeoxyribonuclease VII small subunit
MNEKKELTYEEAFERLESILQQLDQGDLKLDEIESRFEEGMQLASFCAKRLDQVEKKVHLLIEESEGKVEREPFEDELED